MAGWFIWCKGETDGPLGSEELARLVLDGAVGAQDWLWHAELGAWTRAGSFDFVKRQLQRADRGEDAVRASAQTERPETEQSNNGSAEKGRLPNGRQNGRFRPMPEISLTKLYLARLKHEPLARLAVEAATIEAVSRAEADPPADAEHSAIGGSNAESGPDLLAERLATLLGGGAEPSETTAWDAPAWETVALDETGWDEAGPLTASAAGPVPIPANAPTSVAAAGIATGRSSSAAVQPSSLPDDLGIYVMQRLPAE